jgi:hypothetical protein
MRNRTHGGAGAHQSYLALFVLDLELDQSEILHQRK